MKQSLRLAEYFSPLFQVEMLHDFFANNKCKGASFTPAFQTAKILSNMGMTYKPQPDGGFLVFYNKHRESYFTKNNVLPEKLTFLLTKEDRNFLNYSELPYSGAGTAFYFSNLNCSVQKNATHIHMHKDALYNGDELVLIQNPRTSILLSEAVAYNQLSFTTVNGVSVTPRNLQPALEKLPQHAHSVDFSDYPDGIITVHQKGKKNPVHAFYLIHGKVPPSVMGVMDVYLNNSPGSKFSILNKGKFEFKKYGIQFKTRSTYWKYIIVQRRPENKLSGYKISNKQQTIGFSKPEMITLQNGREVAVITSEQPLPLRQFPDDKYELSVQRNGKQTLMQINLPVPKADSIKPDKESRQMFSNMYVYV